ncbi:metallophosphoesterase [Ideonella sp. 4Y11]|uniref:Metallophosphoesterase n=1 Tax=Ideonella aquatica TaxID=2824119 RepID=A0A941BR10_9BURK|nr:metallophosphoesterase [Ideonella aquatica]MBQ0959775.1 metallophosphoesterase [Ideonella aquatica]
MRLQLLSDLHLETEPWEPQAAPGAELLVLAGDIDSAWQGLSRFADWPVPVLMVAGNHEYDGRDVDEALPALRAQAAALGIQLLERESLLLTGDDGRRIRVLGTTRWSDFDVFGAAQRERAMRAGEYFARVQRSTRAGQIFDAAAVRAEAQVCRDWLEQALAEPAQGRWDATLVITHFAPSLRSADPRYGRQPGTASFCNDDEDLVTRADLWLHGHVHCRHAYALPRPGRAPARVVCQARGLVSKGEDEGWDALRLIEV